MQNNINRWGPAILLMAIIFIASAIPGSDIPGFGVWDFLVKKGGHMFGYALLAAAYYHALSSGRKASKWQFVLVLGLTALYAASDEFHQKFTPGRTAALLDVGIDTVGGLVGIIASHLMRKRFRAPDKAEGTCCE